MDPQRQAVDRRKSLLHVLLACRKRDSDIVGNPVSGFRERTARLMPTLFRFLFVLAAIAGIIYGSMVALVVLVEPRERDVTVRVPSERLNPPPQQ